MTVITGISGALLSLGCIVALTGGVGALRMPDFYTRMHPAGKQDSLAQVLILAGLIVQAGFGQASVKLLLIALFLLLTTPSATYAIARAARVDGKQPWTGEDRTEGDAA